MNVKKLLATALVSAVVFTGTAVNAGETLRIGVEGAYPPFSKKEADGSLSGFDIEIAQALCEQMGRECTLVEQEWDGMIPSLMARKFDAIVASLTITEDRKKKISFSSKYYATPTRMIAKEGADFEPTREGMAGKKVGLLRGTTYQCFAEKTYTDSEILLYNTQEDVYADLASGRLDAQISNSLQAIDGFLGTDAGKGFAFTGGDLIDQQCFGEGIGVAVRKNDALADDFSAAIAEIRVNGVYKSINDKYFAIDIFGE
ncbi:transporter substrate-binding domain-containing protein [Neptunomonas sp.]|uniref:transporter substrate-binding domain-containing protein n=1 Tax=Neptunomonas sp. TaxID=1971898 RepID=UPI003566DCF1